MLGTWTIIILFTFLTSNLSKRQISIRIYIKLDWIRKATSSIDQPPPPPPPQTVHCFLSISKFGFCILRHFIFRFCDFVCERVCFLFYFILICDLAANSFLQIWILHAMHNQFKIIHFIYKKGKQKRLTFFSFCQHQFRSHCHSHHRVHSGISFILSENENNMQTIAEKKNSNKKKTQKKGKKKKFKMSANKNANKRQRVDYFASSLFFFFFFVFHFLLWTYPFLLLPFDVIISNNFAILPLEQHAYATDLSNCLFTVHHVTVAVLGSRVIGYLWVLKSFLLSFFLLSLLPPRPFNPNVIDWKQQKKILKFLWRKFPR